MENLSNLAQAIIKTTQSIKGIEKSATIGEGRNAYNGVNDKEVKEIVRAAMSENGLCLIPTGITSTVRVDKWQEEDSYSKSVPKAMKTKQSVFTEVTTKYLLLHTSGENIEVCGYGHGIDTQDKSAGKATTYSLKYLLLYLFLIPTGKIDDSDATHSDELPTQMSLPPINPNAADIEDALAKIIAAKDTKDLEAKYNSLTDKQKQYNEVNAMTNKLLTEFKTKK